MLHGVVGVVGAHGCGDSRTTLLVNQWYSKPEAPCCVPPPPPLSSPSSSSSFSSPAAEPPTHAADGLERQVVAAELLPAGAEGEAEEIQLRLPALVGSGECTLRAPWPAGGAPPGLFAQWAAELRPR